MASRRDRRGLTLGITSSSFFIAVTSVIPDAQLRIADTPSAGNCRPEAQARNEN
jgi:hypothetical protein